MTSRGKVPILKSSQFYDALAPDYTTISAPRLPYLDGIDSLVIAKAHKISPSSYMDVGCGDGRRTLKIATALGIPLPVGVDESAKMISAARGIRSENKSIVALDLSEEFDVITALWNVVGHISSTQRPDAFANLGRHLRSGGLFLLDVNNRYNVKAYGHDVVAANQKADESGNNSGDVTAVHSVNGTTYATVGHVFHPEEIDQIVAQTQGLEVTDKLAVDYSTGKTVSSFAEGQIFYEITKT